jgi:glycosyltransferase involved in cell wall biosynthesis
MDLSFIVPVHNMGLYVEECLRSITASRRIDTEIIVVDDASVDNSVDVVERFQKSCDVSIKLVSTGGSLPAGLGAARNLGLSLASGRYISFIDSDDWISVAVYEEAARLLDRFGADFAWLRSISFNQIQATFHPFNDYGERASLLRERPFILTNLNQDPSLGHFEPSSCNRVFCRRFLDDIGFHFPTGILYEDLVPHYQSLFQSERVLLVTHTGYYYRTFRLGKLTDRNDEKRRDILKSLDVLGPVFHSHEAHSAGPYIASYLLKFLYWCIDSVPIGMRESFALDARKSVTAFPQSWIEGAKLLPVWLDHPLALADISHQKAGGSRQKTSIRRFWERKSR